MHESRYTWKLVPAETKASYYEEFKKYFTCEPDLEAIVYEKWYHKAAGRYKDMVHKFKVISNGKRLDFIPANVWPAWIEYWNTDEVKCKSHVAKKNRLSEPDGPGTGISKHRGGSRCAEEHVLGLAKEKGVSTDKITEWDIFLRLHNPKGDEVFTYDKSKRVAREVRSRIEAMSQSETPGDNVEGSGVDMTSLFLDVVRVSEKKRVFGLGNRSQIYSVSTGDSQSMSQINTNVISNFEDRLRSLETELRDCQARLQTERDEGREEGRQETQQRMEELLQQQMQRQEQQMQAMIES
ncbi:hypothetical protein C2S52_023419 [Perilla frutescens var. hirtella]|nr:hypothetical protein C2S52_023419 [Perilla frutescens var. hirtella]